MVVSVVSVRAAGGGGGRAAGRAAQAGGRAAQGAQAGPRRRLPPLLQVQELY